MNMSEVLITRDNNENDKIVIWPTKVDVWACFHEDVGMWDTKGPVPGPVPFLELDVEDFEGVFGFILAPGEICLCKLTLLPEEEATDDSDY